MGPTDSPSERLENFYLHGLWVKFTEIKLTRPITLGSVSIKLDTDPCGSLEKSSLGSIKVTRRSLGKVDTKNRVPGTNGLTPISTVSRVLLLDKDGVEVKRDRGTNWNRAKERLTFFLFFFYSR